MRTLAPWRAAAALLAALLPALAAAHLMPAGQGTLRVVGHEVNLVISLPVAALTGYWRALIGNDAATRQVLSALRLALTDKSEKDSVVAGDGSAATPWRLPLIGPLALELTASGGVLGIGLGAKTSIDTLGQRCTVVETRIGVKLASIDFAARHAAASQPLTSGANLADLMEALARDVREHGGQLVLGQRCRSLRRAAAGWELELESSAPPAEHVPPDDGIRGEHATEVLHARHVVNACGHAAPDVARWAGVVLAWMRANAWQAWDSERC